MPRVYTSKYSNFVELPVVERRGKLPPYAPTLYVDCKCPHCNEVCIEIPAHLLKRKKANDCLQHLRECPVYGGEAPEKKRKCTNEDVMNEILRLKTRMTAKMGAMEHRINMSIR